MPAVAAGQARRQQAAVALFVAGVALGLKASSGVEPALGAVAAYAAAFVWLYLRAPAPDMEGPPDPRVRKLGDEGPYRMPCGGDVDPFEFKEGVDEVACTKGCRHRWEELRTEQDDADVRAFTRWVYAVHRCVWAGLAVAAVCLWSWAQARSDGRLLALAAAGLAPWLLLHALPRLILAVLAAAKKEDPGP